MTKDEETTLVDVTGLSKPGATLVQKVSDAVGGIFRPYQMKRIARAEAETAILKAETQIQITDLHRRAMHRFIEEEARRQQNMEEITGLAIPLLSQTADAKHVSDDWITNFFDKSRIISDGEMQGIWARVLAGEVNAPGTYSKQTVNLLGNLDASDARLFTDLCGFLWYVGERIPLVFNPEDEVYHQKGIQFVSLQHLDALGLIHFSPLPGYRITGQPRTVETNYFGNPLTLEMPAKTTDLNIGKVMLTRIGKELAPICGSRPVPGFVDYVKEKWKAYLPQFDTEQVASPDRAARGG